jgi:hypothetical protein
MSGVKLSALDQALDIAGSLLFSDTMLIADEPVGKGKILSSGTGASQTGTAVTGLTGMTADMIGNFIQLETDLLLIDGYVSATEVSVATSASHSNVDWSVRRPYCLEDDLNYGRTHTQQIKGTTNWHSAMPTFQRPSAIGTNVVASLTNIAGKTTDSMGLITVRKYANAAPVVGDGYITISSVGNLKHADAVDKRGIPCADVAPYITATPTEETYVLITDVGTDNQIQTADGYVVIGMTQAGGETSPDAVQVKFFKLAHGADLSTATAINWGAAFPATVDFGYGCFERLDQMPEAAFRRVLTLGITSDADLRNDIDKLQTVVGVADEATDLSAVLTNTGNYYPFKNLPDATPSVVEALNTLNAEVGDRDYTIGATGPVITDGQTVTGSIQALVDYVDLSGHITNHAGTGFALAGVTEDIISSFNALDVAIGDRQYSGVILTDGYTVTQSLQQLSDVVDVTGELTNIGNYFPFSDLADPANSTLLEAVNVLNAQVGNRDFSGTILTDGYTVTQSLQQLADAISNSAVTRIVERVATEIKAGTAHTLPASGTYTVGTGGDQYNGKYLYVYVRGLLKDPGTLSGSHAGDYAETSTTEVTFYQTVKVGDRINYFLIG